MYLYILAWTDDEMVPVIRYFTCEEKDASEEQLVRTLIRQDFNDGEYDDPEVYPEEEIKHILEDGNPVMEVIDLNHLPPTLSLEKKSD